MEKDYTVTVIVKGRYEVKVKANSFEEAREIGDNMSSEANFGELTDIEYDVYAIKTDGDVMYIR